MYGCIKKMKTNKKVLGKITLSGIVRSNYRSAENNEDYNIVELMVCRSCVRPFAGYLKFAKVCVTTEEKITKYREQIDTNGQYLVELNHVQMFCNENETLGKRTLSGTTGSIFRLTNDTEVFGFKKVPCVVQQKTGCLGYDANNFMVHKKAISRLDYRENSEVIHLLVHKKDNEVEMYECDSCQYRTKFKGNLQIHRLVHRENSEVKMYECESCHFKTKRKGGLKQHLLVHRKNSEVEMYTCKACNFKTKHKSSLANHILIHGEKLEMEVYNEE
ncbi:hypothetical protein NQ317_001925 [Molorchus minor]|uniref:Protein hunchback n=1 Tax=Molorchus minor TaxID=1323400 RepID=A0ABQ9JE82_9CUCU|nr:hypothetical protein NQ317_001925 [Molorchus minor]